MNQSLEKRLRAGLLRIGRRNFILRIIIIPVLFVTLSFFHALDYVRGNGKRLAMIVMTFFLFATFSSFSFPIFTAEEEDSVSGNESVIPEDEVTVSLALETEINLDELTLLEDEDVLEGYEDAELHGIEDIDKYALDEILESNDDLKEYYERRESQENQSKMDVSDSMPDFSRDDWRLILINKQHPIPENYTFTLGKIKNNMQCDERIIDDLLAMLQGAKDDGVNLVICSPYRDMERQETLFNKKIKRYMNMGMSYMDAYKLSSQTVTVPGASEHQIGLALDIVSDKYSRLDEGFGETEAGIWLKENSAKYGFILRYPKEKEYITGIEYEPWHFRYVGVDAATVITEAGITLEEFWEDL